MNDESFVLLPSLDTKVYSALGNHDYHPKSQFPASPNYIYDQVAEMWKGWLDPESQRTFKKGGWMWYFEIHFFYIDTIAFIRINKSH